MPWFEIDATVTGPIAPQQVSIRRGDRLPAFSAILEDANGTALNLTASRCYLELRSLTPGAAEPTLLARVECVVEVPATGQVSYDWQAAQTLALDEGVYDLRVQVEYDSGTIITVPTRDQTATLVVRSSAT